MSEPALKQSSESKLLQELERAEVLFNILENTWHSHVEKLSPIFNDAESVATEKSDGSSKDPEYNPLLDTAVGRTLRQLENRFEDLTGSISYITRNSHI